jgi:hypothetical protein
MRGWPQDLSSEVRTPDRALADLIELQHDPALEPARRISVERMIRQLKAEITARKKGG